MSYTFDRATPERIIGSVVGEAGKYIAVAVMPDDDSSDDAPKTGYLLAVSRDGSEYVTWRYGWNMAEDGINVWNGAHFPVTASGPRSAYADFVEASDNLNDRWCRANDTCDNCGQRAPWNKPEQPGEPE